MSRHREQLNYSADSLLNDQVSKVLHHVKDLLLQHQEARKIKGQIIINKVILLPPKEIPLHNIIPLKYT